MISLEGVFIVWGEKLWVKTLVAAQRGFEVFDHSEMPVVFASSEILNRVVFKGKFTSGRTHAVHRPVMSSGLFSVIHIAAMLNLRSVVRESSWCSFSEVETLFQRWREKRRQQTDWKEGKEQYCCSDRITACSQVLFDRTSHRGYCRDESSIPGGPLEQKVIQTTQETPSGRSGRCDDSEVVWITLTSHPLWLLSGHTLWQSLDDF